MQQKANTGGAPPALIEGVILLPPVLGLRSKSFLEALYTGEHLYAREIERLVDASHAGVLKALDRFGIPRNGNDHQRTGHLPFGFDYHEAGKVLLKFVTFMEQHRASVITSRLALDWAQQSSTVQPAEWARRLSIVRGFARHRSATDPRTEIPPDGLLPYRPKRARPYIYSEQEIRSLLRAALKLPGRGGMRPWTYNCLLGLLSVTGLRLGEARNLELQDVDLRAGVLTIRGAKFGKSRLVPLHASTCRVLANYLARRKRHWAKRPVSSYVFVSNWGNQLDVGEIHRTFYTLSRHVGLRGPTDSHGPRLHDLRHHAENLIMPRKEAESIHHFV